MPSWFASGSRHADSVNETWFEATNVAAVALADAGRTLCGADGKPVRPAADVVSSRPTASAPRTAVIFVPVKTRFFIPVPSSVVDEREVPGPGPGLGQGAREANPLSNRSRARRRHGHSRPSLGPF